MAPSKAAAKYSAAFAQAACMHWKVSRLIKTRARAALHHESAVGTAYWVGQLAEVRWIVLEAQGVDYVGDVAQ